MIKTDVEMVANDEIPIKKGTHDANIIESGFHDTRKLFQIYKLCTYSYVNAKGTSCLKTFPISSKE